MTTHDMRRRIASDGCCGLGTLLMAKGSEIMSDMNVNLPKMHPQYACFRFCQYAPLQSLLVPPPIQPLARHGRAQPGTLSLPWLLFAQTIRKSEFPNPIRNSQSILAPRPLFSGRAPVLNVGYSTLAHSDLCGTLSGTLSLPWLLFGH